ncbi:MAG: DUF2156 domain-containing protein [Clostridiaceae bacterium]|jgi:hypothetical protein|nr:DUF2156 domain-containing protein [Clostridiaceae bacterium]
MLSFKKLNLEDITTVRPYLQENPQHLCDLTVGATFIWRDFFEYEYTIAASCLIFRMKIFGTHKAYTVPLGKNRDEALDLLDAYCLEQDEPLVFCVVGDLDLPYLSARYPGFHAVTERDYFDYLYEAKDLLELKGRKHRTTRNNISQFKRGVSDWRFEAIAKNNIEDVRLFFEKQIDEIPKDNVTLLEEADKIIEIFDHWELYGMFGGALYVGDEVIGFSLAEKVGNTLYNHVEKADTSYRGVYQMIVSEFMQMFGSDTDIAFINREDDNGDPGLRQSKMKYRPCALISKYTVYTTSEHPEEWRMRPYE